MGGNGWSLRSGISHMTYALQGNFSDLGARGIADSAHAGVSYAAVRSASKNLTARADLQYSSLRDLLGFVGVDNRKNSRSINLGLNADAQDGWLGGGSNRAQASYATGTLLLETGADSAFTEGNFGKFNLDVSRDQALAKNALFAVRWASQVANRNLDSSEKLALGGPSAVRAYSSGELSVDDGALISLEFRYLVPMQGGTLTWSAFYDYGTGSVNHAALPGVTDNESSLKGAGLGVSWRAGADLDVALTAAWRGERLPSADGDKSPRVYFQISKGL
jgi:hemolysin activation/secretion protein